MADTNLEVTLATFLYLIRRGGVPVRDDRVEAACAAIDGGGEDVAALGRQLVDAVRPRLGGGGVDEVIEGLRGLVGPERVETDLGGEAEREARVAAIRRATFGRHLPWLAVIADRTSDGKLGEHWVMVEDVGEEARVMDPNPWDDRPEERTFPIADFMVRWELAGCRSARVA